MKKVLAVLLAVVMAFAVVPVFAFANETPAVPEEEYTNDEIVAAWNANYQLFIDYIFDDDAFLANNYVAANEKSLEDSTTALEVLALNDAKWYDNVAGITSVENAEKLLCSLIERVNAEYDSTLVSDIISVLETATDVYDLISKAAKYSDDIAKYTESLSDVFTGISAAVKVGYEWEAEKAELIEAFSRILSVQAANEYYVEMLEYVKANCGYATLETACANLIDDFKLEINAAIEQVCTEAASGMVQFGAQWAIEVAANTNVYTAAILKVYNVGGDIAEFLWNASDSYQFSDELLSLYYLNSTVNKWAADAYANDADKAVYAVGILISARTLGEEALYNFKLSEAAGFVGKVKEKLQATVFESYEVALLKLDIIHDTFYETDIADYVPVVASVVLYCPVDVQFIDVATPVYTINNGNVGIFKNDSGIYAGAYCAQSQDYLKVAYLYGTYTVKITGTAAGYVTGVFDILGADGLFNDWSFTDVAVTTGTTITVSTKTSDAPVYLYNDAGVKETNALNDDFMYSENPQPTAEEIGGAVVDVVKDESKSFMDKIKEFFQNLFASLFSIFKKK